MKLAGSCVRLNYVSLGLCSTVKDSTLNKLSSNCPDLKFLNLFGCAYLSERGIERLLSSATNLKLLDIRGIYGVSLSFVNRIEAKFSNVEIKFASKPRQRSHRVLEKRRAPLQKPWRKENSEWQCQIKSNSILWRISYYCKLDESVLILYSKFDYWKFEYGWLRLHKIPRINTLTNFMCNRFLLCIYNTSQEFDCTFI